MASSNIKVTSRHHKTRRICGPCVVCGKEQPRYDHFCSLPHGEQAFFRQHASPNIAEDSCICHGHVLEAKRHKSDPTYTPTWKKENQSHHYNCVYPQCSATSSIIVPSQDTQTLFRVALGIQESRTGICSHTCSHCAMHIGTKVYWECKLDNFTSLKKQTTLYSIIQSQFCVCRVAKCK